MLRIRLSRAGAKKRPFYRVVAIDERKPRQGRPLEFLGTFDPCTDPEKIDVRADAVQAWVDKGAQLSPTVASLLRRAQKHASASAN